MRRGRLTGMLALAAVALAGCLRRDDVKLRIYNDGGGTIENIRVYVGGSKAWWPALPAGRSVGVLLRPGGDPPQAILSFTMRDGPRSWTGPELVQGTGYAMEVHIGAAGSVTETHRSFR
jgi:hypothetical protein